MYELDDLKTMTSLSPSLLTRSSVAFVTFIAFPAASSNAANTTSGSIPASSNKRVISIFLADEIPTPVSGSYF